jgi:quinol monooxygenase YgiN
MIHVFAVYTAHPGRRRELLDRLSEWVPGSLPQKGCIEYSVTVDADIVGPMHSQTRFGPDSVAIVEKWESMDHLMAHSASAEVLGYIEVLMPIIASRVVHFMSEATSYRRQG